SFSLSLIICPLILILTNVHVYSAEKLNIFVSIPPQKFIVDKIAGKYAQTHVLLRQKQNPHTFAPTQNQITKLYTCDIFFTIGIPFEKEIVKILKSLNKNFPIIDTSNGLKKRFIKNHFSYNHTSEKHQSEPDPHVWLSIPLVIKQVETITAALSQLAPEQSDYFKKNSNKLINDFLTANNRIKRKLTPYAGRCVYIYHPSLGYFTDEYGLTQTAIEEGGKKPTPKQISRLAMQIKKKGAKTLFAEPQFDKIHITAIANAVGCNVEIINPMEYDLLKNINSITDKIIKSFKND
ncbi:zinc ABC transporter substrate-binding protein, partial [bacterium]|nr:zinc ABC transporter substrate-binding protein [bacterium]